MTRFDFHTCAHACKELVDTISGYVLCSFGVEVDVHLVTEIVAPFMHHVEQAPTAFMAKTIVAAQPIMAEVIGDALSDYVSRWMLRDALNLNGQTVPQPSVDTLIGELVVTKTMLTKLKSTVLANTDRAVLTTRSQVGHSFVVRPSSDPTCDIAKKSKVC